MLRHPRFRPLYSAAHFARNLICAENKGGGTASWKGRSFFAAILMGKNIALRVVCVAAIFCVGLPFSLPACAQEPTIPYAAPRAANTLVMLPDGSTVHVELATTDAQREYGLMGRTILPEGRGMLFVHKEDTEHGYWMYHCRIPLDIVWMDQSHRIVEMSPNTPPCRGKADSCPTYGGHEPSEYVLELPAGSIKEHHLALGQMIEFRLPQGIE